MAPTNKCYPLLRGVRLRATKVDACGAVVDGALSSVVTKGFITVSLTANTDNGTAITVTNAAGDQCINETPVPKFLNYGIQVDFCGVNPILYTLMTGQALYLDYDGNIIGFKQNSKVSLDGGFALELWSNVPSASCEGGAASYGYSLLPFIAGGVIGDVSYTNDAINFSLTGSTTKDGNDWGVGPYDVVDDSGAPAVLPEALDPNDHILVIVTTVPPPDEDCDAVALGTPASGATAGTPGTWTAGYARWDLTDVVGLTATPSTAWSAGQYVVTESGEKISWNATAWAHHA